MEKCRRRILYRPVDRRPPQRFRLRSGRERQGESRRLAEGQIPRREDGAYSRQDIRHRRVEIPTREGKEEIPSRLDKGASHRTGFRKEKCRRHKLPHLIRIHKVNGRRHRAQQIFRLRLCQRQEERHRRRGIPLLLDKEQCCGASAFLP